MSHALRLAPGQLSCHKVMLALTLCWPKEAVFTMLQRSVFTTHDLNKC